MYANNVCTFPLTSCAAAMCCTNAGYSAGNEGGYGWGEGGRYLGEPLLIRYANKTTLCLHGGRLTKNIGLNGHFKTTTWMESLLKIPAISVQVVMLAAQLSGHIRMPPEDL